MDSFTITLSGTDPELKSVFFPPIELNGDYVIGLIDFQSYNSIFNVKKPLNTITYYEVKKISTPKGLVSISKLNESLNGKFTIHFKEDKVIINTEKNKIKLLQSRGLMPKLNKHTNSKIQIDEGEDIFYYDFKSPTTVEIKEGTYEVIELAKEIQKHIPDFALTTDVVSMKVTLFSSHVFDFTKPCLGSVLLGFKGLSTPNVGFVSKNKVNINNINVIRVKCNIANGSYLNGEKSHTIHSFYPISPPGFKIVEVPNNIIYFPVNNRCLDVITISFADQHDRPIDFNGEETTISCHIKKI